MAEAVNRARAAGRGDVLDYLELKSRNDLLRSTAIDWLQITFTNLAGDANRSGAAIQIEHQETYSFRVGSATMVGTSLTLRQGVRALTLESGWPRAPHDGFVRGGGLARANIKHFGRSSANIELMLVSSRKGTPQWFLIDEDGNRSICTEGELQRHFALLLA